MANRLDAWLILDKPAGMSSAAAVAAVKRATGAAKAGHAGTLDPAATGVLPIALGEATKTVAYVVVSEKEYAFTVRWGEARDTDDADGAVVATSPVRPSEDAIRAALPAFTGAIAQIPPAYSAIKVAGERAYRLARRQQTPTLASRTVEVARFTLAAMLEPDAAEFHVVCGKGTYIRSLARDLARYLGTVGHVASLRRLRVGRFAEAQAISLEEVVRLGHSAAHNPHLLAVETVLDDIPALALTIEEATRLRHGQAVEMRRAGDRDAIAALGEGAVVCAFAGGRAVALASIAGGAIRPVRILNL